MTKDENRKQATKEKEWSVIPYIKEDLPKIEAFFKKNYQGAGTYGSMGLFHWKIVTNYIQPGILNIIKDNETIAAITSLVPKRLYFKNRKVIVSEIGDTYVDVNYRRNGLFTIVGNKTRKDATDEGIHFVYGLPNKLALPGWKKRANFRVMENLIVRSFIRPTDFRSILQKKIHWSLSMIFGSFLTLVSFIYFRFKVLVSYTNRSLSIHEEDHLPDDWDDFWTKAKEGFDFIIERDRSAMEWRYFKNPNKYKYIFIRKNNVLVGYLIYRIIHDDESKKLMIADYLTIPGHEDALSEGIIHVVNLSFKYCASVSALWCVEAGPYQKVFSRYGFIDREAIPVISYKNEFSDQIELCSSWHFTLADSDNI